jgi:acylphosphatase
VFSYWNNNLFQEKLSELGKNQVILSSMNSEAIRHKNIRITGRVQGVGFRYSARSAALMLGINGFIRNLPNGDVYLEVEGNPGQVEEYLKWCNQGPPRAVIKFVDIYDGDVVGFEGFEVRP